MKEHMELRLNETLAEAKRHHQSYIEMREQYNNYIEGRINIMYKKIIETKGGEGNNSVRGTPGGSAQMQSIKA